MSLEKFMTRHGTKKTLIIGFDFGTHSTKVVFRERGNPGGHIAQLDDFAANYPPYASPSLVRLESNRLFFGTAALNGTGGQLFSSLKVALLTDNGRDSQLAPGELDSSRLVAAYLAWAFQRLATLAAADGYGNVFINVAAPMSHFENEKLKYKYLQIVQAAWKLSFESTAYAVQQGMPVTEFMSKLEPLLSAPVAGKELRRFEVLPETIAPVVSLSLDPWMEPGMYMIIDTGAGTTEMSIFHAGEAGADQKVLCYQDETMLLGGNDLLLAERLQSQDRIAETNRIVSKLTKQYGRIWKLGYDFDAPNHLARKRWEELTLVLSGGGTRNESVAKALKAVNPMVAWPESETALGDQRHVPGTLELNPGMDDDDGSLFAVANGLAIERRHWPVVFQPNAIEKMEPTEEVADKPQAYWYLDAK